jgi:hypothetical protein
MMSPGNHWKWNSGLAESISISAHAPLFIANSWMLALTGDISSDISNQGAALWDVFVSKGGGGNGIETEISYFLYHSRIF